MAVPLSYRAAAIANLNVTPALKIQSDEPDQLANMHERLTFCAQVLIGYRVEVQLISGPVYEGIFHSMVAKGHRQAVTLKYAKLIKDPSAKLGSEKQALAERPKKISLISEDMLQIVARDVRFNPEDIGNEDRSDFGFETDASISRGRAGKTWGRELQKWTPEEGDEDMMMGLDGNGEGGWDQFAANRTLFGVETTFDEYVYTTKIDRTNCAITEEEAERLAKEIEGQATGNVHLLEERGFAVDDSGQMDEEDKYSAVVRPSALGNHPNHPHHHPQQHPPSWNMPSGGQQPMQPFLDAGSAVARAPAWRNVGSGVAAVAGRIIPLPPPPPLRNPEDIHPVIIPGPSWPSSSISPAGRPIDMGTRRELNKVTSQLMTETGHGPTSRAHTSPYGTPKGLNDSPLINDPLAVRALHIITPTPQATITSEFQQLKQQQGQQKQQPQQLQRDKSQTLDELKKFSSSLSLGSKTSPTSGKEEHVPQATTALHSNAADVGEAFSATPPAAADVGEASSATPPAAADPTSTPAGGLSNKAETAMKPAVPKKFALNPNAKSFTLNISAKEFVPSFGAPPLSVPSSAVSAPSAASSRGKPSRPSAIAGSLDDVVEDVSTTTTTNHPPSTSDSSSHHPNGPQHTPGSATSSRGGSYQSREHRSSGMHKGSSGYDSQYGGTMQKMGGEYSGEYSGEYKGNRSHRSYGHPAMPMEGTSMVPQGVVPQLPMVGGAYMMPGYMPPHGQMGAPYAMMPAGVGGPMMSGQGMFNPGMAAPNGMGPVIMAPGGGFGTMQPVGGYPVIQHAGGYPMGMGPGGGVRPGNATQHIFQPNMSGPMSPGGGPMSSMDSQSSRGSMGRGSNYRGSRKDHGFQGESRVQPPAPAGNGEAVV
ncbi:hypothetical protein CEUSTIGMA_g11154.t1 [Chlamydomonas eustigma]|uniref:LsmAD domain-containing protein n=1 Tax=Chlamydomonas eustigma TaxID=1157962 RepID=A0A250XLC8_9CHLO|nr:hypothetical protein CEUSTIGMA_g11154.t1 [Chlamydomonas eustigma]|eukprot:GAX83729.1 hypothetical protein CEUSTIGMA_g11154.t1 [Chlamydomonas eustigma]